LAFFLNLISRFGLLISRADDLFRSIVAALGARDNPSSDSISESNKTALSYSIPLPRAALSARGVFFSGTVGFPLPLEGLYTQLFVIPLH